MNEAKQLLLAKQYDQALEKYIEVLASQIQETDKAICSLNCAICLINKSRFQEALYYVDDAIRFNPAYMKAYYRKAQILIQLQSYDEAMDIIQKLEPCSETYQLKDSIKQKISDPNNYLPEYEACSTEKDAILLFNNLYSKSDYFSYENILSEGNFCSKILKQRFSFHELKFLLFCVKKRDKKYLDQWLQDYLLQHFQYYCQSNHQKIYEMIDIYLSLFIHMQFNERVQELILNQRYFFLEKYIKITSQLFIMNEGVIVNKDFIQQIAMYAKKIQDFEVNSDIYFLTIDILIILIKPQIVYFDFLKRDSYRYQDLLILVGIISAHQYNEILKLYNNIPQHFINTLLKKNNKPKYLSLINQILMLTLNVEGFTEEINKLSVKVAEEQLEFIIQNRKTKDFKPLIKRFCLLFLLQSRGKYIQLYEYIYKADCEILLEHVFNDEKNIDLDELIVLIQFIVSFDDIKKLIIERRVEMKSIHIKFQNQFKSSGQTALAKLRQYQLGIGYFNFLLQLTLDKSEQIKQEQKERFSISDEEYEQSRKFAKEYQQDQSDKYFTYNKQFIQENQVLQFIALDLKTVPLLSDFIHQYQDILEQDTVIARLLTQFSSNEKVQKYLFDKQCLKLVSRSILQDKEIGIPYLCNQIKYANPDLFDFKEAQLICDALFFSAQKTNNELLTFYALLGIIQLTSLGDYIVDRIVEQKQYIQLQNLLMQENNYIIHASLEIFNNISLNNNFLTLLEDNKLPLFLKIIAALLQQYYDNQDETTLDLQDFSHPKKILITILGIIAIISQVIIVQEYFQKELPLLVDHNLYDSILPYCSEIQIKKIHILWEEYEYKAKDAK